MRAGVVGIAVALVAAMGGMGALAWSVLHGPSKTRAVAAASADRRPTSGGARGTTRYRPPTPGGRRPGPLPAEPSDDPDDTPSGAASASGGAGEASGPGSPRDPSIAEDDAPPAPGGRPRSAGSRGLAPGASPGGAVAAGDAGSACPADMVDTGSFCIDATEVSNAAYAAFLARRPSVQKQPEVCRWNTSFAPVYGAPAGDTKPVIGVDWCDAYGYCAAEGKHLCGRIGGGSTPVASFADPAVSAWYSACTNGGTTRFSYGDTFDASLCFHAGDDGTLAPVGSFATCVGASPPYDQIFDLSGNAWEWEDSCAGNAGGSDLCRVRGGGTHSSSAVVDCAMDYLAKRDNTSRAIGIRCCAERAATP